MPEGKQAVCRTNSHLSNSTYRKIKRALSFRRRVFGQRLEETVTYERRYGDHVAPMVVEQCVSFILDRGLTEVGLFRQPGQATLVKELQEAFDAGEKPTFDSTTDVHTVASLLKLYLRELPEPVVPFSRYQDFLQCGKTVPACGTEALEELRQLLHEMPVANFNLLHYICRFLHEVQSHSHVNKMSAQNLATVFGPNILRPKAEDPERIIGGAALVQQLMSVLIRESGSLFVRDAGGIAGPRSLPAPGRRAHPGSEVQPVAPFRVSCPSTANNGLPVGHQTSCQLSLSLLAAHGESPQTHADASVPRSMEEMEYRFPALPMRSSGTISDPLYNDYSFPSRHWPTVENSAPTQTTGPPPRSSSPHYASQEGCRGSEGHESTLSVYDNIHLMGPNNPGMDGTAPSPDVPEDGSASADSSPWSSCEIVLEGTAVDTGPASSRPSSSRTGLVKAGTSSPLSLVITDGPLSSEGIGALVAPASCEPSSSNATRSLVVGLQQQMTKQKDDYEAQIKSLEQRNEALQVEVSSLRANLEQQRHWYSVAEIKMRNAERARADADRRNALLQQEMEQFFDAFGELNKEAKKAESIIQSF